MLNKIPRPSKHISNDIVNFWNDCCIHSLLIYLLCTCKAHIHQVHFLWAMQTWYINKEHCLKETCRNNTDILQLKTIMEPAHYIHKSRASLNEVPMRSPHLQNPVLSFFPVQPLKERTGCLVKHRVPKGPWGAPSRPSTCPTLGLPKLFPPPIPLVTRCATSHPLVQPCRLCVYLMPHLASHPCHPM